MPKRYNKKELKQLPEVENLITLAMEKLKWSRKKVLSWLEKENPALKKARPIECIDRGEIDKVKELLDKRESDRIKCQKKTI